jgi:hypothetical protein
MGYTSDQGDIEIPLNMMRNNVNFNSRNYTNITQKNSKKNCFFSLFQCVFDPFNYMDSSRSDDGNNQRNGDVVYNAIPLCSNSNNLNTRANHYYSKQKSQNSKKNQESQKSQYSDVSEDNSNEFNVFNISANPSQESIALSSYSNDQYDNDSEKEIDVKNTSSTYVNTHSEAFENCKMKIMNKNLIVTQQYQC